MNGFLWDAALGSSCCQIHIFKSCTEPNEQPEGEGSDISEILTDSRRVRIFVVWYADGNVWWTFLSLNPKVWLLPDFFLFLESKDGRKQIHSKKSSF